MAFNAFTVPRSLVNEIADLQVINKNKNYTAEFDLEYETDDGTGAFLGNIRCSLRVMNGVSLIDDSQVGTTTGQDLSVVNNPELETLMIQLVKQYMKL